VHDNGVLVMYTVLLDEQLSTLFASDRSTVAGIHFGHRYLYFRVWRSLVTIL
jgi:hypothetical protein